MLTKIHVIGKYTFKELLNSRILYITLLLGVAIVIATYVATEFTYGTPEKVALDFGLGMLSLSSLGIALFMGATLLPKEIDSRTVYMIISRPVPRWVFITGKLVGLVSVLVINLSILSLLTLGCTALLGGELNQTIFLAIFFNLVEAVLLLLLVVFFSLFSNNILATIISLVILLLGHSVKETQNIAFVANRPLLKGTLDVYHLVLPGFYKLNFKEFVIYNHQMDASFAMYALAYGLAYSLFLFSMILLIFNRKNLD
jgi:ABC-2 type transport system permease protein